MEPSILQVQLTRSHKMPHSQRKGKPKESKVASDGDTEQDGNMRVKTLSHKEKTIFPLNCIHCAMYQLPTK